ncbi:hypothetical protein [Tumebacillus flagellatus]|uniref:Uncharacterized protein n=1 Tax=Tumebacillus flagellatus TaxID=1157490 RepID=A0A074LLT0_9BACL|nr:hypothetical protein [Tumebacillus flagellatus]KEO81510.1 hypothetical protein EL26_20780 [Tumebacillus flagellatus]
MIVKIVVSMSQGDVIRIDTDGMKVLEMDSAEIQSLKEAEFAYVYEHDKKIKARFVRSIYDMKTKTQTIEMIECID